MGETIPSSDTLSVSCHCGAVAFEYDIPGPPQLLPTYICHCTSCRHFLGGPLLPVIIHIPPAAGARWAPEQLVLDSLTPYHFSDRLTWLGCGRCSAKVLVRIDERRPDGTPPLRLWGLATGVLDHVADRLDFKAHEHLDDTRDEGLAPAIPTYAGKAIKRWPHGLFVGEALPHDEGWRWGRDDRDPSDADAPEADRVLGFCKCRRVQFSILRQRKGDRYPAQLCLCDTCRRTSGLEVTAWMTVPSNCITLDTEASGRNPGEGLEVGSWTALRAYVATPKSVRYNCSTCSAAVFIASQTTSDQVRVAVGLLDAPEGSRAERWADWRTDGMGGEEDAARRHAALLKVLRRSMAGSDELVGSQYDELMRK